MLYFNQDIENQEGYRKGKLRVIEGRKAVHPKILGRQAAEAPRKYLSQESLPGIFFWDLIKVPGMNQKVPGMK